MPSYGCDRRDLVMDREAWCAFFGEGFLELMGLLLHFKILSKVSLLVPLQSNSGDG